MFRLDEMLWEYGLLEADKKAEIDQFVLEHPEYKSDLDDVKEVYKLLASTGLLEDDEALSVPLAYYVFKNQGLFDNPNSILATTFSRLEKKMAEDEVVRQKYYQIRDRIELLAVRNDPVAQFEKLVGKSIEDYPVYQVEKQTKNNNISNVREARPLYERKSVRRVASLLVAGLLVLVAFNFYTEQSLELLESEHIQIHLSDKLRGQKNDGDDVQRYGGFTETLYDDFKEGVQLLMDARGSWLGLFTYYDSAKLNQSRLMLESVWRQSSKDSAFEKEVRFVLGKVYLAEGKVEEAQMMFQGLANLGEEWAEESGQIIKMLR